MNTVINNSAEDYQRFLFKQIASKNPVILDYIEHNENVTPEKIEQLHNFHNSLKNRKMLIQIGKSLVKSVLINMKQSIMSTKIQTTPDASISVKTFIPKVLNTLRPILQFIEPENISVELDDNEYLALVEHIKLKNSKGGPPNLYILIATNMLTSLISSQISTFIKNNEIAILEQTVTDKDKTSNLIDIYNKITKNETMENKRENERDNDELLHALNSLDDQSIILEDDDRKSVISLLSNVSSVKRKSDFDEEEESQTKYLRRDSMESSKTDDNNDEIMMVESHEPIVTQEMKAEFFTNLNDMFEASTSTTPLPTPSGRVINNSMEEKDIVTDDVVVEKELTTVIEEESPALQQPMEEKEDVTSSPSPIIETNADDLKPKKTIKIRSLLNEYKNNPVKPIQNKPLMFNKKLSFS
ncbi:hypothetical protein MrNuV_ORF109 [Macrobrachium rosenbergii nudivirus]|nr:hypothetical protein MrNuV_ORF109 [Macrobrachium rosenbergii nudivirus]